MGAVQTDPNIENQALSHAFKILAGEHRFGLTWYTHCPIGFSYILIPFIKMGVTQVSHLRWIPITIGALAVALTGFSLATAAKNIFLKIWATWFTALFMMQPGLFTWQGALGQHSYGFSLSVAATAIAGLSFRYLAWTLFSLGFLTGWMTYDYLLIGVFGVFTVSWLKNNGPPWERFSTPLSLTLRDFFGYLNGVLVAFVLHLLQNILYFGGLKSAVVDIAGSAFARAGVVELPSRYAVLKNTNVFWVISKMYHSFWNVYVWFPDRRLNMGAYVDPPLLFLGLTSAVGIVLYEFSRIALIKPAPLSAMGKQLMVLGIAGMGLIASCTSFFVLMPHSSISHSYHMPRTFLFAIPLIGYITIHVWRVGTESRIPLPSHKDVLRSFLWPASTLVLILLFFSSYFLIR